MDVRRLAVIDMYGSRGTMRRRRIVVAEFVGGVIAGAGFGTWLLIASSGPTSWVFALWVLGVGLNYAPLAAYAIALGRPGVLDAELAGVDTGRESRRYGLLQFWILVPFALVVSAVRDVASRRA
ncbi:MAG TPA: hypothetical protein VGX23_01350 [Actinocrinis sp.]|nr:hypothetical protein [Actinocrinis sp.]